MGFWEKYDKFNDMSTNFVDNINNRIKVPGYILILLGFILIISGIPLINMYCLKTNETLFWKKLNFLIFGI